MPTQSTKAVRGSLAAVSAAVCGLACTGAAWAGTTYSFRAITANNLADVAVGKAQLFVDVEAAGPNQALFTFRNVGPAAASITDVYFDDGTLLGIAALIDRDENSGDPGVDFSQLASPPNLPGGNALTPAFETTAGFLADSDPPVMHNGVNPGESLGVLFDLKSGGTIDDVLAELQSGQLRIGVHVQGFDSGGSESFVNAVVVPLPAPLALAVAGLGGLVAQRRR